MRGDLRSFLSPEADCPQRLQVASILRDDVPRQEGSQRIETMTTSNNLGCHDKSDPTLACWCTSGTASWLLSPLRCTTTRSPLCAVQEARPRQHNAMLGMATDCPAISAKRAMATANPTQSKKNKVTFAKPAPSRNSRAAGLHYRTTGARPLKALLPVTFRLNMFLSLAKIILLGRCGAPRRRAPIAYNVVSRPTPERLPKRCTRSSMLPPYRQTKTDHDTAHMHEHTRASNRKRLCNC